MKKTTPLFLLFLLFFISKSFSQSIIHAEYFEGADFVGYSIGNADTGVDYLNQSFMTSGADRIGRGPVGAFTFAGTVTGNATNVIGGEDIDFTTDGGFYNSHSYIKLSPISILGKANLTIDIDVAFPNTFAGRYEITKFFIVDYRIDGGATWNTALAFYGDGATQGLRRDTNLNGTLEGGEAVSVNTAMTNFTLDLNAIKGSAVVGSSMDIRVRFNLADSHEEFAFDNIILKGVTGNSPPTNIALSSSSINENVAANSTVGTLSSTDVDAMNTFTYTLVSGTGDTDNASFNISGSNLRITNSPNFETKSSYSVRIRTTDQDGLFYEKSFALSITDLNEAPTDVALSANTINENVAANTVVGTLSSIDLDASNTFTYSLVTGTGSTDNGAFNISGSDLRITNSPDYEMKSSYAIRIRTTDQGGLNFDKQFTVMVNNINDLVPVITSISTDSGVSATDYITNDNTPTVNGTAEPGTTVSLLVNGTSSAILGTTVTTNGSGIFTFPFPTAFGTLTDGVVTLSVTSSLGGVSVASVDKLVTIDTKATIAVTTPIAGDNTIDNAEASNLTLSGTSTEVEVGRTVTLTIADGVNPNVVTTTTTTAGGAWTKSGINISSLNNGAVSITATVTDVAGNMDSKMETATLNKATLANTDFSLSRVTFALFPNPVITELKITNTNDEVMDRIEVYSATGVVVKTAANTNSIDLSSLAYGIYLVKINAGESQVIKKIIKE